MFKKVKLLFLYKKLMNIIEKYFNKTFTVSDHLKIWKFFKKIKAIIGKKGDPMKTGWKTTEFWVAIGSTVAGMLVVLGVITPDLQGDITGNLEKLSGGVISVISVVSYIWSRTKIKRKEIDKSIIEIERGISPPK